jgi:hypothetical protein
LDLQHSADIKEELKKIHINTRTKELDTLNIQDRLKSHISHRYLTE